ncbi:LysM peptidoglycan-binding domain-containing protein [Oceanicella actignis]|uniref:LysM peptidoglycan-binding domain-containing protein n=1 Tax=Oceanicella actignis TaxID=1189325 RepID=UPI0011E8197B|nr:LysM peptidoglycan-binding domain-containing protein [Oceanicella actignis]TYO89939.1 LysM domain-containing protein [Oceanicella actignis]
MRRGALRATVALAALAALGAAGLRGCAPPELRLAAPDRPAGGAASAVETASAPERAAAPEIAAAPAAEPGPGPGREPGAASPAAPAPASASAPVPDQSAAESAPASTLGTGSEAVPAEGREAAAAPSFDIARVEPDGAALIAGRAAPGAEVELTADGAPVARARAGADGAFVLMAELPVRAPGGALRLGLRAFGPDGTAATGAQEVIVLAPSAPAAPGREDAPRAGAPGAEPAAVAGGAPTPPPAKAEAAPAVVALGPEGARLVQPQAPADGAVTLDLVSYDEKGAVTVSGRGSPGAVARVYADGAHLGDAAVDGAGAWSAQLDALDAPGDYTLRVDEVDRAGKVRSRLETPFRREPARALTPGQVVVQPGASLWRIARAHYGAGARYVVIYEANRARIRDPDLIYPGQVFDLPGAPR